ncbi:MAG: DUF6261 family protein [Tannerellaceae bacterium]|jgi:hypothetical protein|nr:DUF6261 family protein [Tannerellaceae bacterium]
MKEIHEFPFKMNNLRNAEHFQLHASINQFLEPRMDDVPNLAQPWNTYHWRSQKGDELYKRSTKLEETKDIKERDLLRDEDFKFFGRCVAYESHSLDANTKAAAERLGNVYAIYNGANTKAYAENTALVTNLLQDLELPENKAAVETLSLTPVVESLKSNNTAVETLYDQRSEALSARRLEGRLAVTRLEMDKDLLVVVNGVNSFYVANEYGEKNEVLRAKLGEIIDGINARIEQTGRVYARRTGRKAKTNGGTTHTPETPQVSIPHLMMQEQKIYDDSELLSGMASKMSAEAVDAASFARDIYPAAIGGEVRIHDGVRWEYFPIESFIIRTGGGPVCGFVLSPPESGAFASTYLSEDEAAAEVLKDGVRLATLGGLKCPATIYIG